MSEIIDFSGAIAEVEALIAKLKSLGVQADLIDKALKQSAGNHKEQLASLNVLLRAVEQQQKGILDVRRAFSGMIPDAQLNNLKEVVKQLGAVDAQGKKLAAKALISTEAQVVLNNQLSTFLVGQQQADTFLQRQLNKLNEQGRTLAYIRDEGGKSLLQSKAELDLEKERLTVANKLAMTLDGSRSGILSNKADITSFEQGATFAHRMALTTDELNRRVSQYNALNLSSQAILKERIKGIDAAEVSETKLSNSLKEAERSLVNATKPNGKRLALLKEITKFTNEQTIAEEKLNNKLTVLHQTQQSLVDGFQREIAIQQEVNRGVLQQATYLTKLNNEFEHQKQVQQSIVNGTLTYNEQLKLTNKEMLDAATSETKLANAILAHERALAQLNSTEGKYLEDLKRQIREAKSALNATVKEQVEGKTTVLLTADEAKNLAATKANNSEIERKNALLMQQAGLNHTLTNSQALIIAQTEKATSLINEQNEAALKRARTEQGLIGTEKELADLRKRREEQILQLQAANTSRRDPSFAEMQRLKAEIRSYDDYINKRINGTVSESHVNSQLISSMRAGLNALGSSIGFFSAQTMLAASATYAFTSNVRQAIIEGAQFQKTMATAAATFELPTKIESNLKGNELDKAIRGYTTLKSLEASVTNLGSTSTLGLGEVAKGLVTVGQAGFDASQAMSALKPILDAAVIGNISVERSTTIVSAAIHQFGLGAEGAAKVVDLLALGATKSSTTVENLGHALAYAGSVAKEVGWTIEETTSAIATMAKSGVDKDRAGTAMRQLAVSLANPVTKEAEAVMQKYGLSLRDASNNAVGLFTILDRISKIKPVDRTKAINDLVGVYAAPGVTGLIQNLGSYVELEQATKTQLAGTARSMRETMSDNLESDFKLFQSSIEGMRKIAFDTYDSFLRDKIALFEKFVVSQNDAAYLINKSGTTYQDVRGTNSLAENIPKDSLAGFVDGTEQVITKFDVLISKTEQFATLLLVIGGGLAAKNLTTGLSSAVNNAAKDLNRYSEEWLNYSRAVGATTSSTGQLSLQIDNVSKRQQLLGTLAREGSGALDAMAWAAKGLGKALGALATAGTWAIALYGLYEVYQLLANDKSTIQRIIDERAEVDNLKRSYAEAKAKIQEYYDTKERKNIKAGIQDKQQIISDLQVNLNSGLSLAGQLSGKVSSDIQNALRTIYDTQLNSEKSNLAKLQADLAATSNIATQTVDNMSTADQLLADLVNLQKERDKVTKTLETDSIGLEATYVNVDRILADIDAKMASIKNKIVALANISVKNLTMTAEERSNIFQFQAFTPTPEMGTGDRLKQLEVRRKALEDADNERVKNNLPVDAASQKEMAELNEQRNKLLEQQQEAKIKLAKTINDNTYAALEPSAKIAAARKELAQVNAEMADLVKNTKETQGLAVDDVQSYNLDRYAKLVSRQGDLQATINSAATKIDKQAASSAKQLESSIDSAMKFYVDLQSKVNPVEAISLKYEKAVKQLGLLVKIGKDKGGISEQDYQRSLIYLQNEKNNAIEREDDNYRQLYISQNKYYKESLDFYSKYEIALGGQVSRIGEISRLYNIQTESVSGLVSELIRLDAVQRKSENMGDKDAENIRSKIMLDRSDKVRGMVSDVEIPTLQQNLGNELMSPFMTMAKYEGQNAASRLSIETAYTAANAVSANKYNSDLDLLNNQFNDEQLRKHKDYLDKKKVLDEKYAEELRVSKELLNTDLKNFDEKLLQNEAQSKLIVMGSVFGGMNQILSGYADVSREAESGQKAAFIAQKALAVAQILLYGEVAAMKARSETPVFMGQTLATMIRIEAGISAGMVAGLAIAEYRSKGEKGKSNYAGAYDNGGTIPAGSWGIVGEYAPEIVTGPARVVSRKDTAKLLAESGQQGTSITIAPVINVTTNGSSNGEKDGKLIGETVKAIVVQTIREQTRPNGYLDTFVRNKR